MARIKIDESCWDMKDGIEVIATCGFEMKEVLGIGAQQATRTWNLSNGRKLVNLSTGKSPVNYLWLTNLDIKHIQRKHDIKQPGLHRYWKR